MNRPENNQAMRAHWQTEDFELEEEHEVLLRLVRDEDSSSFKDPSPSIDRQIKRIARVRNQSGPENHWILGQGPRVILVTMIMFAIAMVVLLAF